MGKRSEIKRKREQQSRVSILMTIVIVGVLLITAGSIFLLRGTSADGQAGTPNLSTIPVEVNYPAPRLSLENIKGGTESLSDFQDNVVLVNNWATWCPPCKAEMPTLVSFYNDHAKDGLTLIAIEAGEPASEVQKFVDQFQMPFHVWLDPKADAADAFKNNTLPNSYVIDRTGTVRLMWVGEIKRDMLEKYVTPLLSGN